MFLLALISGRGKFAGVKTPANESWLSLVGLGGAAALVE
jgi:hypothetical protein